MRKLLIVALTATTAFVGCKDERNNFMVDDSISFANADLAGVSVYNEKYELAIIKNGKGQQSASASIVASDAALEEYNTANGTDFVPMPANCYKLISTHVGFSDEEIRKYIDITWKAADILALDKDTNYAIAVQLSVDNGALEVDKNRNVKIIQPKFSTLSMESVLAKKITPNTDGKEIVFEGSMMLDYAIPSMDLTVNYTIDNSLVADYNAAHETNYEAAPDGFAVLAAQESQIAAGETTAKFTCKLHSEKLFTGKTLNSAKDVLIPVRITSTSANGLEITNSVTYIPVSKNGELKGPWTMLEGNEIGWAFAPTPGQAVYTGARLFDGRWDNEWISFINDKNTFPMVFVVDMGKTQVFTKFRIGDSYNFQGTYRDYEISVADEYNGTSTSWTLVASGMRDYTFNSVSFNPPYDKNNPALIYDYPVQKMVAGRYLKFVIVKCEPTRDNNSVDSPAGLGRGKLGDVQGVGF